jgi:hypothetical protein
MEEPALMKIALASSLIGLLALFIVTERGASEKPAYLSELSEEGELFRVNATISEVIPRQKYFLIRFYGCGYSEARVYDEKIPPSLDNLTAELTLKKQNGIIYLEEIKK